MKRKYSDINLFINDLAEYSSVDPIKIFKCFNQSNESKQQFFHLMSYYNSNDIQLFAIYANSYEEYDKIRAEMKTKGWKICKTYSTYDPHSFDDILGIVQRSINYTHLKSAKDFFEMD